MGLNNNRASISFSDIGDADLLEVLTKVNYNFAGYCKDLMRDGLMYRRLLSQTSNQQVVPTVQPTLRLSPQPVKQIKPTVIDKTELKRHVESKFDKL